MTCPNCGSELDEAQLTTCPHCDVPLTTVQILPEPAPEPDSPVPIRPPGIPLTNVPQPLEDLATPEAPSTDATVPSQVTEPASLAVPHPLLPPPASTSPELGVVKGLAPVQRHRLITLAAAVLVLIVVIVGATGYYIARQNPVIYQSSLKGSLDNWENDADCAPKADGYHIMSSSICYAPIGSQTNADIKVTVVQQSGSSDLFYGIALRSMPSEHYYLFAIDGYGKWLFVNIAGINKTPVDLVDPTLDVAVRAGLHQANTLQVQMKGTHFEFSINGIKVGEIIDSHYATGQIGLSGEDGVAVVYTDLSIVKVK